MKINNLTIDDFLEDADFLHKHAMSQSYTGVTNPVDNVTYPDVTINIFDDLLFEICGKLGDI